MERIKQVNLDDKDYHGLPFDEELLLGVYFVTSEEEEKIVIDYYKHDHRVAELPSSFFKTKGWYAVYNTFFDSEWGNNIAISLLEEYLSSTEKHVNFLRQATRKVSN